MEQRQGLRQAIKDYREGKAEAFTPLYEESNKYIYTCIFKVMSGNDNAQDIITDIMQDTYVEISKSISQLESEERFLQWAGMIATRKCYAYLKKNKRYVLLNEEDSTFDNLSDSESIIPEEVIQDKEKQRLVREIIENQLTEMQKLCVIAFYYNQQKQSEIAQELGIPENTVKTNLSRAKVKIKEGVLDLEKKDGIRLHNVAPFLLLLFKEDVQAAVVPAQVTENVMSSVVASAGVKGAGGVLGKIASASTKTKIISGIIGIALLGTIGGIVIVATLNKEPVPIIEESVGADNSSFDGAEEQSDSADLVEEDSLLEEEIQTWQTEYAKELSNPVESGYLGFDLHDFDSDGVPELVINKNGGLSVITYKENECTNIDCGMMGSYEIEKMGYGQSNSELIFLDSKVDSEGNDTSMAIRHDNFQMIEEIRTSSIAIDGVISYEITDGYYNSEKLSYEEGQQRMQEIKGTFVPIEFKALDEQTIKQTLESYK